MLVAVAAVLAIVVPAAEARLDGAGKPAAGAVFVGTNHNNTLDASQPPNQVAMYNRAADGTLTLVGYFNTGGQGSGPGVRFAGDGLGAGNSVKLTEDGKQLLVANAGSNNVSLFKVKKDSLELTDLEPTGNGSPGQRFPNSVTQHGKLVYVLNSADQGSITGFKLEGNKLAPIPGTTRYLNANQSYPADALYNPAQVSFTPDGSKLVVTIKDSIAGLVPGENPTGPGRILVFSVDKRGVPSATYTQTNVNNRGPFGFSFDRSGNILVAEFIGGPGFTGAAGSYRINADNTVSAITAVAPDFQLDSCWLVNNGTYAFTANYSTNNVSSFRIGADGSLTLLQGIAGTTETAGTAQPQGSTPLDMRTTPDGNFLYVVLPGAGKVAAWRINFDGSLTKLGEFAGLPRTVDGDHAPFPFGGGGSPAGIDAT
jgi:6-phosphogluconolactonase (cycloisomerase 2 family)